MEQKYKKFPYFGKGELLTSESLNNSFGYNDEQTRFSRRYLLGYGIVEGLTYTYTSNKFIIHPGVGVTPNGVMVKIEENMEYTKAEILLKDGMTYYRLCSAKEKGKDLIPLPKGLKSHVVELQAAVKTTSSMHCTELSCDARSTEKEIVVNAFLRPVNSIETKSCVLAQSLDCQQQLIRLNGCVRNINILRNKLKKTFNNNQEKVYMGLYSLCNILNPAFSVGSDKALIPLKCWRNLFDDAQLVSKELFKAVKRYFEDWHNEMTAYPIYYFQFMENMNDAINECLDYYLDFVYRYPIIGVEHASDCDSIFIGLTNLSDISDRYRSHFVYADKADMKCRALHLEMLLLRVVYMRKNFIGGNNFEGCVDFAWANCDKPISERFVPYYYKSSREFCRYWHLNTNKVYEDYNFTPDEIAPDLRDGKRLLLQGCYMKDVDEVFDKVIAYIEKYHLDITVEKIKLVKKTLRTNPGKNKDKNYAKLLTDTIAKENDRKIYIERAEGNEMTLAYSKLTGDLSQLIKSAAYNIEVKTSEVNRIRRGLENVTIKRYVDFLNESVDPSEKKIEWSTGKRKKRDVNVNAFMALKSYYDMSYKPEYDSAEYLHGCPNGAKLLLFHFNGKLFFEATVKK